MSVDQKVYELACVFCYADKPFQRQELAARIQDTIEEFLVELEAIQDGLEIERQERAVSEIPSPL